MSPILEARSISKAFGGVQALKGVTLSLEPGKVLCLLGENGSGKSTLIKILAGALRPDSGSIHLKGKCYPFLTPREAVRAGVHVIYQDLALFPNLSVAENLALNTLVERGSFFVRRAEILSLARKALASLEVSLDMRSPVEELSQMDKQIVAIGRALLGGTNVLIMDEPTAALTHFEAQKLLNLISQLKRKGISVLFVSHRIDEALSCGDSVVVLKNGESVLQGPISNFDREKIIQAMTARKVESVKSERVGASGEIVLEVKDLQVGRSAEGVSFNLREGEVLGFAGFRGAGRGSVLKALFGLEKPSKGEIFFRKKNLSALSPKEAVREGIAYLPEDRLQEGLFLQKTVGENLTASVLDRLGGGLGLLKLKKISQFAMQWILRLGIRTPGPKALLSSLSGGNQQKVLLGKWLATNAKVLLLNRPTVGIDVGAKQEIHSEIRSLAERGFSLILVSDDLPELCFLSDRILLFHRGRIVKELERPDEKELSEELSKLG